MKKLIRMFIIGYNYTHKTEPLINREIAVKEDRIKLLEGMLAFPEMYPKEIIECEKTAIIFRDAEEKKLQKRILEAFKNEPYYYKSN